MIASGTKSPKPPLQHRWFREWVSLGGDVSAGDAGTYINQERDARDEPTLQDAESSERSAPRTREIGCRIRQKYNSTNRISFDLKPGASNPAYLPSPSANLFERHSAIAQIASCSVKFAGARRSIFSRH